MYCRKYKKIQEVMAEISGFGSIALVVINFIFLIVKNEIVTSMISTDYYGELSLKKEHLTNSDIIKMANTGKINISSFNNNNTVDYLNKDSSGVNNKVTTFSQQLSLKKIIITPKNLNFQKNDKMFIYQKATKSKMVNAICCLSITPFEQQGINSIKRKLDLKNKIRE